MRLCEEQTPVGLIRAWTKLRLDVTDAEAAVGREIATRQTVEAQLTESYKRANSISSQLHEEKLRSTKNSARMQELEDEVRALRLKAGGKTAEPAVRPEANPQKVRDLEAQVAEIQSEKDMVEKQLVQVEERCVVLQQQVGGGQFDSESVKVLRFRKNPSNELERLREENKHLEAQLKDQEERRRSRTSGEHASTESTRALESKIAALEQEKRAKAKELAHMKKALQMYMNEYRTGIFALLGWNIEMHGSGATAEWHLKSRYHQEEELVFRPRQSEGRSDVEFDLVQTGWAERLKQDRQAIAYLDVFGSIPGFLSQITVDVFTRNTLV
jgi:hypothetical protein